MELLVTIRDKIATYAEMRPYVCGNSDYVIHFDMDEEWAAHETKTARFVKDDGTYHDQVFTGNDCPVPVISNTFGIRVGVFAGDLHTTTPAYIPAKKSILCGSSFPADPAPDVYAQIMEHLNQIEQNGVSDAEIKAAIEAYLIENPIEGVTPEEVNAAIEAYMKGHPVLVEESDPTVPNWAKQPEKPTYTPEEIGAQPKGDYALKSEIPKVPVQSVNGQTGNVQLDIPPAYELPTASADVKGGVKVGNGLRMDGDMLEIVPDGEYELLNEITVDEDTKVIYVDKDMFGQDYNLKVVIATILKPASTAAYIMQAMTYVSGSLGIYVALNFSNSAAMGARMEVYPHYGYYKADGYMPNVSYSNSGYAFSMANDSIGAMPANRNVCKVSFAAYSTGIIAAGTQIKIWGVRA